MIRGIAWELPQSAIPIVEEHNVLESKLDHLFGVVVGALTCVFPHMEKIVEDNEGKVTHGSFQ